MTITCSVCQNTDFYEDAEGQLSCTMCGVQSQDYLAVSNDLDENVADTRNEKRTWQSRKSVSAAASAKNAPKRETASITIYLEVFQYCLKLLVDSVPRRSDRLIDQVKHLWTAYLTKYLNSEDNYEPTFYPSTSNSSQLGSSRKRKTSVNVTDSISFDNVYKCTPPYKPLLLAFLYLAIRQLRLPILPSDLVRWCVHGVLPYSSLFEKLPINMQQQMPSIYRKRLVEHFNPRVSTTSNILYNTSVLASYLDMTIQPLNAPLVVRTIISALGLPFSVWSNYARLSQLARHESTLQVFESEGEMYVDNIMAQVIICVMLCPDWDSWIVTLPSQSKVDSENVRVSVPPTLPELSRIARNDLKQLLMSIRATLYSFQRHLPHVPESVLTFNLPVQNTLRSISPSVLLGSHPNTETVTMKSEGQSTVTQSVDTEFWSRNCTAAANVTLSTVVLSSSTIPDDAATKTDQSSSLPCYLNHIDDPGMLLPTYTALLERCAVYLYTTPAVLFRLVVRYETKIAELAQLLNEKLIQDNSIDVKEDAGTNQSSSGAIDATVLLKYRPKSRKRK